MNHNAVIRKAGCKAQYKCLIILLKLTGKNILKQCTQKSENLTSERITKSWNEKIVKAHLDHTKNDNIVVKKPNH